MVKTKNPWLLSVFLFSGLRRLSYRTPMRAEAMRKARIKRGKYKCAICGGIFGRRQIAVDHISPVVNPLHGFVDWNTYIERLFCSADGLQILCNADKHSCHKKKSKEENRLRRLARKDKKKK